MFLDDVAFKEMDLEVVSEDVLDYKNRASKIKPHEPLTIFPIYNRDIVNREDQIEEGVTKLQNTLRNLTPEKASKIVFRVTPGPNWYRAETEGVKENFKEAVDAVENELIQRHGQKWAS